MKTPCLLIVAVAMAASAAASAQQIVTGSEEAIRNVVSGKTCVGADVLTFGTSVHGAAGTYDRHGRPNATYSIGYGTILVRRDGSVHGHLASVSVPEHMLYLSTSTYRCGN